MSGIACRTFLDIMCFRFVAYSPVFALSEEEVTAVPPILGFLPFGQSPEVMFVS